MILVGIVALAFNLRPAAVSVGPVLEEVSAGLHMSHSVAGLLTSLPVLAFAFFGALSPWAAARFGAHRVTAMALVAVVLGLAGRAVVDSSVPFLALSMLALAGMAAANVLLPSLVKRHFPDKVGAVTAAYTTSLAIGLTAALTLTVPVTETFDSWRAGLGVWAIIALVALLPWLGLLRSTDRRGAARHAVTLGQVARTRLGWAMAVFFGLQSMQAYAIFGWFAQLWRDSGYSAATAGVLVGILGAVSIPLSLLIPAAAARRKDQRGLLCLIMACYPIGYVGLLVAPHSLALLWAVVVGIGACTFPLILTMIGLRSRTPAGTAALSGFTQSAGYLLAAVGPFTVGALYDASGGWTVPIWFLLIAAVPQFLTGLYAARPRFIEDELTDQITEPRH